MLTPESRLSRSPDPLTSEIDGELVMMDVESGKYFNLDAIGTDIWNRIGDGIGFGTLCAALAQDYDAEAATIARDVTTFVTTMADKGLVRIEP